MAPDPQKVQAVHDWPAPADSTAVRQFLGLASYYRQYILQFTDIAAPFHALTKKGVAFALTQECADSFTTLKNHLLRAPVLAYPRFSPQASEFVLQTGASAAGLGAVEQDGHVIVYASRSLTALEQQYSVIQRECLAVVYALKQFRHYLLGRHFQLLTDHAPLQWLCAQKMEGMLCRWALAMQEYDFHIVYRKGSLSANADALSPRYQSDQPPRGREWRQHPLRRYRQLWAQLKLVDGVLCRNYIPSPMSESVTVPILPASFRQQALIRNHDTPSAGHQGSDRTLERLRNEAYWVSMAQDVERYCRECTKCQQSKLPMPPRAPLRNVLCRLTMADDCR